MSSELCCATDLSCRWCIRNPMVILT